MRQLPSRLVFLAGSLSALLVVPTSCGFGTAGVVASLGGGGGGSSNAPAAPTTFQVVQPKLSPADIRIVMTDAEGNDAEVEFFFSSPSTGGERRRLTKVAQNPVKLSTSRGGTEHRIAWDFANEPGIGTVSLTKEVELFARVVNGVDQALVVDLGNDAPVVVPEATDPEVSGIVPLVVQVADSSEDPTSLDIEYRIVGEAEDAWRPARPGGLEPDEPTPTPAFTGLGATESPGTRVLFFWDSGADLRGLERDVVFRYTASDPVATAGPVITAPFRVDNNARPTAQINDGFMQASSDRHRTIPVPVTVFDDESDRVDVVLQWRRFTDPEFEDLGTNDAATLRNRLKDAVYRREKQIASIGEIDVGGAGEVVDPRHVRTSVLALDGAWAVTQGLAGKEIELLRPVNAPPVTVSTGWAANALTRPVAVLPLDLGVEAVVLQDVGGTTKLDLIEVQTGVVKRPLAAGVVGTPTAMCWSSRQNTVLVATQWSSGWIVYEVMVDGDGSVPVVQRAIQPPNGGSNVLRGIVARSTTSVLATSGDQLLQIDWASGTTRAVTLMRGMSEPHGLVLDSCDRESVMIAERTFPGGTGAGRVARWNLRTRTPQAFLAVANVPVRPSAMATDPTGNMLFVLSEPPSGGRLLRRYRTNYSVGPAGQLAYPLPPDATCFGVGETGAWVAASPNSSTLVAHGGASHRRTVVGYDPANMRIEVDADLAGVGPVVEWRIAMAKGRGVLGAPEGRTETVLWDSSGLAGVESIVLRVVPLDDEIGPASEVSVPTSPVGDSVVEVPGSGSDAPDLDGDGDRDILSDGGPIRLQQSPRVFANGDFAASGASVTDWNGDGRNDLVVHGGSLNVRFQTSQGTYPTVNLSPEVPSDLLADLDGDGLADLVSRGNPTIVTFGQPAGGWSAPTSLIPSGTFYTRSIVADVNDDSLFDIVFFGAPSSGQINVEARFQQAGRTFTGPQTILQFSDPNTIIGGLWVADMDVDGTADLVVGGLNSPLGSFSVPDHATVFYRNRDGTTEAQVMSGRPIGVADLDGNGLLDVVGIQGSSMQVAERRSVRAASAFDPALSVDVDGDGWRDAVSASSIQYRRGSGSVAGGVVQIPGRLVGDCNGDTLADAVNSVLLGGSEGGVSIDTRLQRPSFGFPAMADYSTFLLGMQVSFPVVVSRVHDIDGDGASEVVHFTLNSNGARLRVGLADEYQVLLAGIFFFGPSGTFKMNDVDRDGRLDVAYVAASTGIRRFSIRRRDPVGGLAYSSLLDVDMNPAPYGTNPVDCAFGDVDGDGLLDVAVAGLDGRTFLFKQAVVGGFSVPVVILPSAGGALSLVDVDADGRCDVVRGAQIYWGAPGAIGAPSSSSDGVGLGLVDLDRDRLMDLIGPGGNTISRQLAPRVFLGVPNGISIAADSLFDVDHDGELDAVGADRVHFGDR